MNVPTRPPTQPVAVVDLRAGAPPPPGEPDGTLLVQVEHDPAAPDAQSSPVDPYSLRPGEPVALGVQRVALGLFDQLVAGLRDADPRGVGLVAAWEAVRRLRAILRTVRQPLGDDLYRREDGVLRRCIEVLTPVRDLSGAVAAARSTESTMPAVRLFLPGLETRRARAVAGAVGDADRRAHLIMTAASARARFASAPVHPGTRRKTARRVILPDAFRTLEPGILEAYERGRSALTGVAGDPVPPSVRRWLRAARVLRDQLELVRGSWPVVLDALHAELGRLVGVLGEEQDDGELAWQLTTWPERHRERDRYDVVVGLETQRAALRREAVELGHRLYAEPGPAFVGRLGAYWRAWRGPISR